MTQKIANVVMEYIEPLRDGGGKVIRTEAWRATSLYFDAPNGRELADSLASYDDKSTVLTLPADKASALGHKWITEKEMRLLVSLSDETEQVA